MKQKITLLLITVILLTSCNSSKSVRLKSSSNPQSEILSTSASAKHIDTASIVHIDKQQRLITIRSTYPLKNRSYYTTKLGLSENQNSLIKINGNPYEKLFIGDILEGTPRISDSIYEVVEERAKELDTYYTEATID